MDFDKLSPSSMTKVVYNGSGRPELKRYTYGEILNTSTYNKSALVRFRREQHPDGYAQTREEWVGAQYLQPYKTELSYVTDAVSGLEKKKAELQSQIASIDLAISALKDL